VLYVYFLDQNSSSDQWDCIVISAADEEQKACFEMQLNAKINKGDIPSEIKYLVIADPPGVALGAGGSTFFILKSLESIYKEELYSKKIWIVHAGRHIFLIQQLC
jgi:fucose-1-phosphate guanylyltransferase